MAIVASGLRQVIINVLQTTMATVTEQLSMGDGE